MLLYVQLSNFSYDYARCANLRFRWPRRRRTHPASTLAAHTPPLSIWQTRLCEIAMHRMLRSSLLHTRQTFWTQRETQPPAEPLLRRGVMDHYCHGEEETHLGSWRNIEMKDSTPVEKRWWIKREQPDERVKRIFNRLIFEKPSDETEKQIF